MAPGVTRGEVVPVDGVPVWRSLLANRFVRFLLVGGLNTVFGYGVFALFILMRVPYPIAALLATVLGILFNFKSYGTLVFGSRDNRLIFRFFFVYGIGYAVGVGLLALGKAFGVPVLLTGAVIAIPVAGLSFVLNRSFVFRSAAASGSAADD
jgi:putative flippase GtrA